MASIARAGSGLLPALVGGGPRSLRSWLPWTVPLGVLALPRLVPGAVPDALPEGIAAIVAVAAVLLASRRPDRCLVALLAFLPFQLYVPAWLYAMGVPTGLVRPLAGWREVLGLAIAVAAVRAARREHHRADALTWLCLGYVALTGVYALVPRLFSDTAPLDGDVRSLGWRASATFLLLLVACRHAGFLPSARDAAERALRIAAVVVALAAVWEFVDDDSWNDFAVDTVQVTAYQREVLDSPPVSDDDVRFYGEIGGRSIVRVGSVFGSPLTLGHFLLLPFGLTLERALRGRTSGATAAAALIGAAILFTQTRSAMLGALVVGAATLRRSSGRTDAARSRFWLLLVGITVAATPFIAGAGLTDRFSDQSSNEDHQEGFFTALGDVIEHPLGLGLGTSAGVGQRFGTATSISENYYLQVGNEVGVLGLVLFVAVVVVANRRLRRARDDTGDAVAAGARSAFLGISVAAFFLHSYADQSVAWTAFALAGVGLGAAGVPRRPAGPATMAFARHPTRT